MRVMSSYLFYVVFVFLSLVCYLPSFWATFAWSGENNSFIRLLGLLMFNIFFIFIHILHAKTGYLPVVDKFTSHGAQWFSLFVAVAYVFSMPGTKKKYMRFINKKF